MGFGSCDKLWVTGGGHNLLGTGGLGQADLMGGKGVCYFGPSHITLFNDPCNKNSFCLEFVT